jgi:hypothetical protein
MNTLNDYKAGYDNAVKMISYEGQLIWSVFRSMVSVNAFITAFNLAFIKFFDHLTWLILLPSICGLFLCICWILLTNRMFSYYKYWFLAAREFEKNLFDPKLQFLNIGQAYSNGNEVNLGETRISMPGLSRLIRNKHIIHFIIAIIGIIYLTILIYTMVEVIKI